MFELLSSVLALLYRQDLANIVRRRGYKLIRELLAASREIKAADSDVEGSLTDKKDKASTEEDELTGGFYCLFHHCYFPYHFKFKSELFLLKHLYFKGLDENRKELAEDVFVSSEDTIMEDTSNSTTSDDDTKSDVESFFLVDGSTKSSMQEKVAKFIQSGELDTIEGKSH